MSRPKIITLTILAIIILIGGGLIWRQTAIDTAETDAIIAVADSIKIPGDWRTDTDQTNDDVTRASALCIGDVACPSVRRSYVFNRRIDDDELRAMVATIPDKLSTEYTLPCGEKSSLISGSSITYCDATVKTAAYRILINISYSSDDATHNTATILVDPRL